MCFRPASGAVFASETSWQAIRPIHERFMQNAWEKTPVKWMTYLDLNLRLPELLLMRLDKMGMGVSLETRVPFLDHKFVELAMSIPEQVITRGNESKHILKKAVRGLIPDDIIDRREAGVWRAHLRMVLWTIRGVCQARTVGRSATRRTFLDQLAVMKLIQSGRGRDAWFLLNFALWWKEFIEARGLRWRIKWNRWWPRDRLLKTIVV